MTKRDEIARKPTRTLMAGEIEREMAGIRAGLEMSGVPFTSEAEAAARAALNGEKAGDEDNWLRTRGTARPPRSVSNGYHNSGAAVLRNRLGYADPHELAQAEALIAATRMAELAANPIDGSFDFAHLQMIHRYVLGDIFEWAGGIRTTDTVPGDLGIFHVPPTAIANELDRVFSDINSGVYVNHHSHEDFVHDLAGHWGDLTSVHPFAKRNTPTQRVFFDQLARDVGWAIEWREVSVAAVQAAGNFAYIDGGIILADVLRAAIKPITEVPADAISTAPRGTAMTFPQHWQAMIEHYDTTPEQTYTWANQIKREASQHDTQAIEIRPLPSLPLAGENTPTSTPHVCPHSSSATGHPPSATAPSHHTEGDRQNRV